MTTKDSGGSKPTQDLSVSVSNPQDGRQGANNTFAARPPLGHYVIIGRGVTAWYNHLTLLRSAWGRARISHFGLLPMHVMHIGYEEPWSRREDERMGQPPRMLNFFRGLAPNLGLEGGLPEDDWLQASKFAAALRGVEQHLYQQYDEVHLADGNYLIALNDNLFPRKLSIRNGFVGIIEKYADWNANRGNGDYLPRPERDRAADALATVGDPNTWGNLGCPYRLSVYHDRVRSFVYAYKIDICTGPGQPRLFHRDRFATQALYEEHLPVRGVIPHRRTTDVGQPRIIDGNEYIGSTNDPRKSVIVFKGNPVGAQSVQSALDMPFGAPPFSVKRAYWITNKAVRRSEADVPGARNLLEIVGSSPLQGNEQGQITTNHPAGDIWSGDDYRAMFFGTKLHRVGWYEVGTISEGIEGMLGREHGTMAPDVRGITCHLVLNPYGDSAQAVPPGTADNASNSLKDMLRQAGVYNERDGATFNRIPGLLTMIWDGKLLIMSITADLFVFSLGQERGPRAEGTVAYMTQKLGNLVSVIGPRSPYPMALTDTEADPDLLEGTEGRVRVLGSAILTCPSGDANVQRNFLAAHKAHGDTIPQEGPAGGGGLNLAIPNIGRANRFTDPPLRLNTASMEELLASGLSGTSATIIVGARSLTDRGHTVAEYQNMMGQMFVDIFGDAADAGAVLADAIAIGDPARYSY